MTAPPDNNAPTIFVAFGATGDLMHRKVIPALYYLYTRGRLSERFCIMGFSRRDWSDKEFREYVRSIIEKRVGSKLPDEHVASLYHFLSSRKANLQTLRAMKRSSVLLQNLIRSGIVAQTNCSILRKHPNTTRR